MVMNYYQSISVAVLNIIFLTSVTLADGQSWDPKVDWWDPRDGVFTQMIMEALKKQLQCSNSEFGKLRPRIERIMALQQALGPDERTEWSNGDIVAEYGWGNLFQYEALSDDLSQYCRIMKRRLGDAVGNANKESNKVKPALDDYLKAKADLSQDLKTMQNSLALSVTARQKAWLTVDGLVLGTPYAILPAPFGVYHPGKLMNAEERDRMRKDLELGSADTFESIKGTPADRDVIKSKTLEVIAAETRDGPIGGRQVLLDLGPTVEGASPDPPPSPLQDALTDLRSTLEIANATDEQIKAKTDFVWQTKAKADAELAASRKDLAAILDLTPLERAKLIFASRYHLIE
jgi:hypothetical protein